MRLILAGSRSFGAAAFRMLQQEGHEVAGVWSPHDPEDKLTDLALTNGAFLYGRSPAEVKRLEVDLIVAAHSHDFIGRHSRAATKLGAIGYHPSLLPRHRGRDAVEWTVRMGDPVAGGTVYWLTDSVDAGPVAWADWCHVRPGWDASRLWREELYGMGIRGLKRVLRDVDQGVLVEVPQDEACATWEPSIGRQPLFRPELTQIGKGVNGYKHVVSREEVRHGSGRAPTEAPC